MLLIPTASRITLLAKLTSQLLTTNCRIGLYKNNKTPAAGDVIGDYTPADFTSYAGLTNCANWTTPVLDSRNRATSNADLIVFAHGATGAAQDIYGYYAVNAAGALLWAERDPAAPVNLTTTAPLYAVVPTLVFGDVSQCIDTVMSASGHNTVSSGGITATWSSTTPAGALLVAVLYFQAATESLTPVVPTGWTEAIRTTLEISPGDCYQIVIAYKPNAAAQSVTETFGAAFGVQKLLQVAAFTNINPVPLDAYQVNSNGTEIYTTGLTSALSQCKELVIGAFMNMNTGSTTSDPTLNAVTIDARAGTGGANFYGISLWLQAGTALPQQLQITFPGGPDYNICAIATFKMIP